LLFGGGEFIVGKHTGGVEFAELLQFRNQIIGRRWSWCWCWCWCWCWWTLRWERRRLLLL